MAVVHDQFLSFVGSHCRDFLDAVPNMIMALNSHRQVVFANKATVIFLGHSDLAEVIGRRPGEAFGCINAPEFNGGCGTSRHCRSCGAVLAILAAIEGTVSSSVCQLLRRVTTDIESLDLHVCAAPIAVDGQSFVIFAITDITHETRCRSMERIFFHDVLNLAGGISGLSELLSELVPQPLKADMGILRAATASLVDEVMAQRDMVAAENNELKLNPTRINSQELLHRLQGFYAHSAVAQGRHIVVDQASVSVDITADERLVQRVLGNMLKNALESEPPGGTALISCREEGDQVVFSVHNQGHIPQAVQDSIFRRSFSTKGSGRGQGTFSMLLLAERYLGGSVGFCSTEAEGTVFFLRLPKEAPAAQGSPAPVSGQPRPQTFQE